MPEGDTIHRTADALRGVLLDRPVTAARARPGPGRSRVPDMALVLGATVTAVEPRGKHLLIRFDNGLALHTHMRMSGSWHRYARGEPWRRPERQASVVLEVADAVVVCFNAPVVELLSKRDEGRHGRLASLGPDLLGAAFDPAVARAGLRACGQLTIGEALLDQRAVAGIGNVYKSEVLWLERVDPWAPVTRLTDAELDALIARARRLLAANVRGGARITTGGSALAGGGRLWVYGRAGRRCRRCGARILRRRQGEQARLTYWCPACQAG